MIYYILIGLLNILGWGLSYLFFKPYLKRFPSKTIYKGILFLGILSFVGYLSVIYLTKGPDFFEAGIEQLKINKYINDKVGDFQSYTYDEKTFNELKNQASFDVQLDGKGRALFLTCVMKKNNNRWLLSEIKLQKLVNQRE